MEKNVTSSLMVDDKTDSVKGLNNLTARKRLAHRATVISLAMEPGLALISFTFSSPSR